MLTPLELQAKETLEAVMAYLTHGKISHENFLNLIGQVRDALYALRNKASGCASGLHASFCTCTDGKDGRAVPHGVRKPRKNLTPASSND